MFGIGKKQEKKSKGLDSDKIRRVISSMSEYDKRTAREDFWEYIPEEDYNDLDKCAQWALVSIWDAHKFPVVVLLDKLRQGPPFMVDKESPINKPKIYGEVKAACTRDEIQRVLDYYRSKILVPDEFLTDDFVMLMWITSKANEVIDFTVSPTKASGWIINKIKTGDIKDVTLSKF